MALVSTDMTEARLSVCGCILPSAVSASSLLLSARYHCLQLICYEALLTDRIISEDGTGYILVVKFDRMQLHDPRYRIVLGICDLIF